MFSKKIYDNYITGVCEAQYIVGTEITEQEYNEILSVIRSCPTPSEGKGYRLRTDLTWEEYDLPIIQPIPEPVSLEEFYSAMEEIL